MCRETVTHGRHDRHQLVRRCGLRPGAGPAPAPAAHPSGQRPEGSTPSVPGLTLGASAHDPDHRHRRTPEQVESLLIKPVLAASVALNPLCSRVRRPTPPLLPAPAVTADRTAAWVAEGAEIPVSDLQTAEVDVVTKKVAGLSVVTSELAEDSSPEATAEVGRGLARDIARKVDAGFFADGTGNGGEQPDGLASLTVGTGNVQDIAAGTAPTNLDAFAQAQMLAADVGAQLTAFVT